MRKAISSEKLTDTLEISLCHDGYWLYDYSRGMNLSMRAKTEKEALVEAISYYQKRFYGIDKKLKALENVVENFISGLREDQLIDFFENED